MMTYFMRSQINFIGPTFAYYAVLSMLPAILSLGMAVSMFGINKSQTITMLRQALPKSIENVVIPIVHSVLDGGDAGYLTISIVFTLWSLSRLLGALRQTFNRIYNVKEIVNDFFSRIFGILWLLGIIFALVVLVTIGGFSIDWLNNLPWFGDLTSGLIPMNVGLMILIYVLIILLNYGLPSGGGSGAEGAKPMLRFNAIGSFLVMLALWGLNKGFNIYAQYVTAQYTFYRTLSAVIVLLIWLNLIGVILALGQVAIAWFQSIYLKKDA